MNVVVNVALINFIGVFAASISTLVAFLSMFVIRYIDVNKSVKMKIKKTIILGSVIIGGMLIFSYYSRNSIIQIIALVITVIYAFTTNIDMLKSAINVVKEKLGK